MEKLVLVFCLLFSSITASFAQCSSWIQASTASDLEVTQFTFELIDEGMYFVTVTTGDEIITGKVMVSK